METRTSPKRTEPRRAVATDGGAPCPPGTTPLPQRRAGAPLGPSATIRRLTRSLRPWGTVVNAATAYPLAGIGVRARATGKCSESVLGGGTTDRDGDFRVVFDDDPCVLERLRLLELDEAQCVLEIQWSQRESTTARCPVSGSTAFPQTISVQLPSAALGDERWRELGGRLEQSRIAYVHTFAQELIAPARTSAFGDLDLETRHSALIDLEQAFLDPKQILRKHAELPTFRRLHDGGLATLERQLGTSTDPDVARAFAELEAKVTAYRDLLEVDWVLDPTEIAKGDVGGGVTKFAEAYTDTPVVGPATTPAAHLIVPTDLGRYRDYLRTIFTGGTKSDTYDDNLALLEKRFRQDFETYDDSDKPANGLLIPIVKAILTASPADYGFGIAANSIQAQGTKTTREYLDYLIGLSQLKPAEFARRYRLDVDRSDGARSTRVAENVSTLQRFLADGFQDKNEPSAAVPPGLRGRAPFFLYFEEWLSLQRPFFAENVYQPAMTFSAGIEPEAREQVKTEADSEWVVMLMELEDDLAKAMQRLDQNEYGLARDALLELDAKARAALHYSYKEMPGSEKLTAAAVSSRLEELKAVTVKVPSDLAKLIAFYRVIGTYELDTDEIDPYDKFQPWLNQVRLRLWCSLIHLVATVIPTYLGDCAFALGDYPTAIDSYRRGSHLLVARGQLESKAGYPAQKLDLPAAIGDPSIVTDWEQYYDYYGAYMAKEAFYMGGGLPYTVDLNTKRVPDPSEWSLPFTSIAQMVATAMHPVEQRFLKLRQGQAMLEWADALYRTDDASNIQRARELYKSVLWLHGSKPTTPLWGKGPAMSFATPNPARTSQTTRAWLGIEQIEAGLNWYGFNDDLVPALRYRPLKDAADRYAAAARSAQQDFILSLGKLEDSIREGLVNANMLKKATLQAKIAQEQVGIAEFGVVIAQQQVEAVKAQIEAKKQEIADHDSLIGQFGDLIEGYSSVIGGIPSGVTSKVGTGVEVGTGMTTSEAAGMSAAAGGACVMGAMAAFVVIGVMTLDNMADAQLSRHQQLHALEDKALPLAQAGVAAKEREVRIAQYQGQIAAADIELAKALMQFQQSRFLNEKLWSELGAVMKRVMRRYLVLGGRYGWLAERALAFEQDRPLDIVRFEYFPMKLQGITGADLLQADLAELDAARLDGIKQTVPVKRTLSLLADFPLQFAQLKQSGRCTFMTREEPFRFAYPGTYGYRIRAVTVTPRSYSGVKLPRGQLSNIGLSIVSRSDGSMHALLRPPDALPLSEFRLADDMQVYGLPDEALLAFEGSGVETVWELTLPAIANDLALDEISDIELTFDVRAHYSPQLQQTHLDSMPTSVRRLTFFSARAFAPAALEALRDPQQQSATIEFDVPAIGRLPRPETNRKVRNVVVMAPGHEPLDFDATLTPQGLPAVQVSFADSVAYSNAEPLTEAGSQTPPSPLNVLVGENVDTTFQLAIAKNGNADAFAGVEDVLLGIEYTADLV